MPPPAPTRRDWLSTALATTAGAAWTPAVAVDLTHVFLPFVPGFDLTVDPPRPMLAGHLGDDRFRSDVPLHQLLFNPDGRRLYGLGVHRLIHWDVATGRRKAAVRPLGVPGEWGFHRLGPILADGSVAVIVRSLRDDLATFFRIVRFDGSSLAPLSQLKIHCHPKWSCAFHPAGGSLFVRTPYAFALYDLTNGREIWTYESKESVVHTSAPVFSPDGHRVASMITNGDTLLIETERPDITRFQFRWAIGNESLRIEWSPDGRYLMAAAPDFQTIHVRDLKLGCDTEPIHFRSRFGRQMMFAREIGFFAANHFEATTIPNPGTDESNRTFNTGLNLLSLAVCSNRRTLAATNGLAVHVIDLDRNERLPQSAEWAEGLSQLSWTRRTTVAAEVMSRRIAWRLDKPRQHEVVTDHDSIAPLANRCDSPDGTQTAAVQDNGIRRIERSTGKILAQYRLPHKDIETIVWTRDGRFLIGESNGSTLWRISISDGRQKQLTIPNANTDTAWSILPQLHLVPNRFVAGRYLQDRCEIACIDLDAVKVLWQTPVPNRISTLETSNDGRRFFMVCRSAPDEENNPERMDILIGNAKTGRIVRTKCRELSADVLDFSPDFRIAILRQESCRIVGVELATLEIRFDLGEFEFQRNAPQSPMRISPDSRYWASAGQGRFPVDLFDLRGELNPCDPLPGNYALDRAWHDLRVRDGKTGFRAVRWLAGNPAKSIPFLRSRISPVPRVNLSTASRWIGQLDHSDFDVRNRAFHELTRAGIQLTDVVSSELERTVSAEVRARLRQVLLAYESASENDVSHIRACEALEWMETNDAKQLLREWAGGAKGATLTEEAEASLARLESLHKHDPHSPAIPAPSR